MPNELTVIGPTSNLSGGTITGATLTNVQINTSTVLGGLVNNANISTSTMNGGKVENATHNGLTITTSTAATLTPLGGAKHTLAASTGTVADVDVAQSFTAGQRGAVVVLTDGASVAVNLALGNNFSLLLGTATDTGARTLANPSNAVVGQSGFIIVTTPASAIPAMAFGNQYKFAGTATIAVSTATGTVDQITYYAITATSIALEITKNFA